MNNALQKLSNQLVHRGCPAMGAARAVRLSKANS
jgi:hypothetical protein